MFARIENARSHFQYLQMKTAGKFVKIVGNRIASLNLEEVDGVHSDPDERSDSHFTFHEFEETDLVTRVVKTEIL